MLENIELLDLIITGIVIPLLPLLFKWINTKIKNEQLQGLAVLAEESAAVAAKTIYQTYVKDLKAKAKDGHLTDAEKKEAKRSAMVTAKEIMGPEAKKLAIKLFKNEFKVEKFIHHRIEAAIHDLKNK